jgi:uncharacterized protein involved in exopolysaccharide biosynthesis
VEKLYEDAQKKYFEAQKKYAAYADANQSTLLRSAGIEAQRLQNEATLAFGVYNQLAQQLQVSKAKVQEVTPVYTIVQPATIPLKAAKPSKIMILIGFIFLGGVGCIGWILFGRDLVAQFKTSRSSYPKQQPSESPVL